MKEILLIDDENDFREILAFTLENSGFAVTEADSGIKALECMRNKSFDLIITDLLMPEMSGSELIKQVNILDSSVKIIAVTGGGSISDKEDLFKDYKAKGIDAILKKPFNTQQIITQITTLLNL